MKCKNCDAVIYKTYCANCGEKRFDSRQLSTKHFVEETFEGLVHFDNKFFRTLWLLFTKPGQLSVDYVEGRRVRSMKPIQFFVVINLVFFILMMNNPYSLPLNSYLNVKPFKNYSTRSIVEEKLKHDSISEATYEYIFDDKINSESKEFIFIFIPLYAFIFWVFFFMYHRRFFEHLIFATHFVSLVLCYYLIQSYLIEMPTYWLVKDIDQNTMDTALRILLCTVVGTYLSFASRRFYKARVAWSIFTGLLVGGSFFYLVLIYRMILFYKIMCI
jgi:hypothetical protein